MGFQQGLSGLLAASKDLQVIGNNIANTSTVGFKLSNAEFSDLYAKSMNLSGSSNGGIGVAVATVAQQFTQGDLESTSLPLDIAINGDGFFRVTTSLTNNTDALYTRNGQFQLDKNGYIVNPTVAGGAYLNGWPTGVNGGDPSPIKIDTTALPAKQTTKVSNAVNLNSSVTAITQDPAATDYDVDKIFDPTDGDTYHHGSGVTVYDSLGNDYSVQTYYVKTGAVAGPPPTSTWNVYATVDGVMVGGTTKPYTPIGTMTYGSNGALSALTPTNPDPADPDKFIVDITAKPGAENFSIKFDYAGSTQTNSDFVNESLEQDGTAPGTLLNFNVDTKGVITGSYSNGETRQLGQVLLVNFANPNGLSIQGDNAWRATNASGEPVINKPGVGRFGTLRASTVEKSNVDMTTELVHMIVAQRVYQANAQTIKTEDAVLQTLVNLR